VIPQTWGHIVAPVCTLWGPDGYTGCTPHIRRNRADGSWFQGPDAAGRGSSASGAGRKLGFFLFFSDGKPIGRHEFRRQNMGLTVRRGGWRLTGRASYVLVFSATAGAESSAFADTRPAAARRFLAAALAFLGTCCPRRSLRLADPAASATSKELASKKKTRGPGRFGARKWAV